MSSSFASPATGNEQPEPSTRQLAWYTTVSLAGEASDEEDGPLTGDALVWTTDQTAYQDAQLGTSTSLTVRLYRDSDACSRKTHVITLTAIDSDGNVSTTTRSITIWTFC